MNDILPAFSGIYPPSFLIMYFKGVVTSDSFALHVAITSLICIQTCDGRLGFRRGIEASRVGEAPESNHFINVSGHIGIFSTFPAIVHSLSASLFSVSDEYAQSSLSLARI